MLGFRFTNQFKKDLKLLEKRHYNLDDLFDIIIKIMWVMIYYFCEEGVVFTRTGTHSDYL